jgi:hypothetical protein
VAPATRNNASSNRLLTEDSQLRQGMSDADDAFSRATIVVLGFRFPIVLSGCNAKPECDSFETRNAVLRTVSDDHNNVLGEYAAKNSTTASDAGSEAEKSRRKPLYVLVS